MPSEPKHVETDGTTETHVPHFQSATMENEVVLSCGELKPVIAEDGQSEVREIRYDTKLRVTPETAFQLKELLVSIVRIVGIVLFPRPGDHRFSSGGPGVALGPVTGLL